MTSKIWIKASLFCFLLPVLWLISCKPTPPSEAANELFAEKGIDSTQAALIFNKTDYFPNRTQVSIAILTDSGTVFLGVISRNDTILSVHNQDVHFEIGSITKVMTATLLADFVVRDKLKLTDSISTHLPVVMKDSTEITFEQLANNTSGLPNVPTGMLLTSLLSMRNPYKNFDEKTLAAYLENDLSLSNPPGKSYSDSNLGFGLLGYTLSKVDEKSIDDLLEERIFKKYKMSATTTHREDIKNTLVPGLNKDGKHTSNWDMAALGGAGAALSTAEDLAKFAKAHCDTADKVLALTRNPTFNQDDKTEIGLAWRITRSENGNMLYSQRGSTGGYTSCMIIDPNNCRAVVVLSNVSGSNAYSGNLEELCFGLMKSVER
ncbi:beta-lactamase family protein [Cryomorpha ignava]|uniref:Beta-lactamase family protein n=1 Tax=Cryomorpha ignava TaxID=101383 RepID=A0A7K3WRE2_9FLAO|nr:serine hydrolase domain-containing protein [Cryomorpha ignava]NEN24243.1 beta-lactamase family protein [Cryomorpha ignava]